MALEPKTKKIILISIGILALLGLAFLIYKLAQPSDVAPPTPGGSTSTTTPGILTAIQEQYCKLFPNSKLCGGAVKPKVNCVNNCDANKPGYNCVGLPDIECGFGA